MDHTIDMSEIMKEHATPRRRNREAARLLLADLEARRRQRVARVRERIAQGAYGCADKLDETVERMLEDLEAAQGVLAMERAARRK